MLAVSLVLVALFDTALGSITAARPCPLIVAVYCEVKCKINIVKQNASKCRCRTSPKVHIVLKNPASSATLLHSPARTQGISTLQYTANLLVPHMNPMIAVFSFLRLSVCPLYTIVSIVMEGHDWDIVLPCFHFSVLL